jgi:hypothetical protein
VERGLIAGETLITEGTNKLTPGIKVRVVTPEEVADEDHKEE